MRAPSRPLLALAGTAIALSACSRDSGPPPASAAGLANPASENCIAKGGVLRIETAGDGGQYGVCLFEDNRQCEEWALLRGECPVGGIRVTGYITPQARYCAIAAATMSSPASRRQPHPRKAPAPCRGSLPATPSRCMRAAVPDLPSAGRPAGVLTIEQIREQANFPAEGDRMTVRRIVANLAADDPARVRAFYEELLDLEVVMDHGWIVTLASKASAAPQLSIASEGGSGTPVPDLSIEVDDVDAIHRRALAAKLEIVYGLTDEPWGVRRFYVRDPLGRLINILSHPG